MPVVSCPHCGASGNLPDAALGRGLTCRACQKTFTAAAGGPRSNSIPRAETLDEPATAAPGAPPRPVLPQTWCAAFALVAAFAAGSFTALPFVWAACVPFSVIGLGLAVTALVVAARDGRGVAFPAVVAVLCLLQAGGMVALVAARQSEMSKAFEPLRQLGR